MGWTWKSIVLHYVCIGAAGSLVILAGAGGRKALQNPTLQGKLREQWRALSSAPSQAESYRAAVPALQPPAESVTAPAAHTAPLAPLPVNPYRKELAERRREFTDFQQRVRALTAKRDQAEGAERMRIIDELGSMRSEGIRLSRAYGKAKAKYQSWDGSAVAPNSDVSKQEPD